MKSQNASKVPATYEEAESWLLSLPRFSVVGSRAARFALDPIREFCEGIGSPHRKFRAVHVAGTNGKGSVCAMLASVYTTAGLKTGLYTSPHLRDIRERFRINGELMPKDILLEFIKEHFHRLQAHPLTFFELTTVIAFWYFAREKVDLAIIETGLGGRLDATNIINPDACVITSIGLDHTEQLGDTLESIAFEKAGILKPGVPFALGPMQPHVMNIISEKAKAVKARHQFTMPFDVSDEPQFSSHLAVRPFGEINTEICHTVVQLLSDKFRVSKSDFIKGILRFFTDRWLPGRFERLHPELHIYFDGAHNADAMDNLVKQLGSKYDLSGAVCVVSLMKDKINNELARCFQSFGTVLYFEQSQIRAAAYSEFKAIYPDSKLVKLDTETSIELIKSAKTKLVLFTGSFYFYSIVSEWMDSQLRVPNRLSASHSNPIANPDH